jgi:hypothetical protein
MAILDDDDTRRAVKEYVKASGLLKDAYIIAGYKSPSTFFAYLKKHPDFHAALKKIQRYSDPAIDPEIIEASYHAIRNNILHGSQRTTEDIDPDSGRIISRRVTNTGASKWAIEKINQPSSYVESALKMIIASLIHFVSHREDEDVTDEFRQVFFKILAEFKRNELIELIQKGKPVKEPPQNKGS